MSEDTLNRVEALIVKAQKVLATYHPNPPNFIGFPNLDTGVFNEWRSQTLSLLMQVAGSGHVYTESFRKETAQGEYTGSVNAGLGILKALREDIRAGAFGDSTKQSLGQDALLLLDQICTRFHLVARQLRSRRENRPTLSVTDEYDVQDLMHALLWLHFEDIRPEEWTPSYAGKSSRMDFLLKREQIVVETKKTRPTLTAKEIGTELIEDIARYEKHPDCRGLICFVYDPDGFVANPRGIESDLARDEPFPVRVLIRPK
jgi:hypothetical protein